MRKQQLFFVNIAIGTAVPLFCLHRLLPDDNLFNQKAAGPMTYGEFIVLGVALIVSAIVYSI